MTVWLIGGVDPSHGAGISRDEWTMQVFAPHLTWATVITAYTQQGDGRPARSTARDLDAIASDLRTAPAPKAIKIGLVPQECVEVLVANLVGMAVPIVLDPVLWASDTGALGSCPQGLLRLAQYATLITPNAVEATTLTAGLPQKNVAPESREPDERTRMSGSRQTHCRDHTWELALALGPTAVLYKNIDGDRESTVRDVLWNHGAVHHYVRVRREGPEPRGTGCALATAIACGLAEHLPIEVACARGIAWLDRARTFVQSGPDGRPHMVARRP